MKHIHRLVYVQPNPQTKARTNWLVRTKRTLSKHLRKKRAVMRARSEARKRGYDLMIQFTPHHKHMKAQPRPMKRTLGKKMHRTRPKTKAVKRKTIRRPKTHVVRQAFRAPSLGLSRSRIGQKRMRPGDLYEKQMVGRLQHQTGMTHFQIMNLVNLGKQSDYIDVETEIASVAGHSAWKPEIYERAKKNLTERLHSEQSATHRYSNMSEKDLGWEINKYEDMAKQYYRNKPKVNVNVI